MSASVLDRYRNNYEYEVELETTEHPESSSFIIDEIDLTNRRRFNFPDFLLGFQTPSPVCYRFYLRGGLITTGNTNNADWFLPLQLLDTQILDGPMWVELNYIPNWFSWKLGYLVQNTIRIEDLAVQITGGFISYMDDVDVFIFNNSIVPYFSPKRFKEI